MGRKKGNKPNPTDPGAAGSQATSSQQSTSNQPPRRTDADQPSAAQGGGGVQRDQFNQPTSGASQGQRFVRRERDQPQAPRQGQPFERRERDQPQAPRQGQPFERRDQEQRGDRDKGARPPGFKQFQGGQPGHRPFQEKPSDHRPFQEEPSGHRPFQGEPSGHRPFQGGPSGHRQFQGERSERPKQYDQRSGHGFKGQRDDRSVAGYGARDSSQTPRETAARSWKQSEPTPASAWESPSKSEIPADLAPKGAWGKPSGAKVEQAVAQPPIHTASVSAPAPESEPKSGAGRRKKGKGGKSGQPEQAPQPLTSTTPEPKTVAGQKQADKSEKPKEDIQSVSQSQDAKAIVDYKPENNIPLRKGGKNVVHTPAFTLNPKGFPLAVNYLEITFKKSQLQIYRYDVEFEEIRDESKKPKKPRQPAPGRPGQQPGQPLRLPKSLLRPAVNQFLARHARGRYPAFDGRKSLFAAGTPLPFGDSRSDVVDVMDQERAQTRQFNVTVKLVDQNLNLERLNEYIKNGRTANPPQDVIQALDVAIRQAPINTNRFLQAGQSFFLPPDRSPIDLGDGFELWTGYQQSGVLAWKTYLNVDVSNKAFPKAQPVMQIFQNDLGNNVNKLRSFIRGLKVDYMMPAPNQAAAPARRTYTIRDIGSLTDRFDYDGRQISVAQYFTDVKKVNLRFPTAPTLMTSNGSHLPMEFCKVSEKQTVMRRLNENQTSQMVRSTALSTDIRRERIFSQLAHTNFNRDNCLGEFNVSISNEFETVNAVILKPPSIQYDRGVAQVDKGQWRQEFPFLNSCNLDDWVVINTHYRTSDEQIKNLIRQFQIGGRAMNMRIAEPRYSRMNARGQITDRDFVNEFRKNPKAQIYLVVMDDYGIQECYSKIKRAAELESGVVTQCIKSNTVFRKGNDRTTIANILLKINAKLGGLNHELLQQIKPWMIKGSMIVGADVTHPAPGSNMFSIAAVAASYDDSAFKYRMRYKLQPPTREMIDSFSSLMCDHLNYYFKKNGRYPARILYFRDGVSEGQFQQVLDIELRAIRDACMKMGDKCRPLTTFLVVQKRHHTRFFPAQQFGDRSRNNNVKPGTLVDTQITHPTELNFYLVSHQGIQGTSKPTKYHLLWDDNNFGVEELEQLTYYLCHMFARCNRSVSYPAPTYYAHLAAFRARAYWTENYTGFLDESRIGNPAELERLQAAKGTIRDEILNFPMFFC